MSVPPAPPADNVPEQLAKQFRAASEAAELWPEHVLAVIWYAARDEMDLARMYLLADREGGRKSPLAIEAGIAAHSRVIYQAREDLAAASEGTISWEPDRGRRAAIRACYPDSPEEWFDALPPCWDSAHEAALSIALTAREFLTWPVREIADGGGRQAEARRRLAACSPVVTPTAHEAALYRSHIRRERATLLARMGGGGVSQREGGWVDAAFAGPPPSVGANAAGDDAVLTLEEMVMQMALVVGDDVTKRVMVIANQRERPGEDRMLEILHLDTRFAGKRSPEWATLLGVTADAVRGYDTWKRLRRAKKSSD